VNAPPWEDLLFVEPTTNVVHIFNSSGGTSFPFVGYSYNVASFGHPDGRYYIGDINGDSKADLLFADPDDNSVWARYNSTPGANGYTNATFGPATRKIDPGAFGHLSGGGKYY
jgi:hypothetical protein